MVWCLGIEPGSDWGNGGWCSGSNAGPAADTTGVGALNPGPGQYQWFAGGGGGGWNPDPPANPSQGGVGGGGNGGNGDPPSAPSVVPAKQGQGTTGGGGGGGTNNEPGAAGGSGIVIIRYQIGEVASTKASGGTVTQFAPTLETNKTVHVFTSSGVLKNPSGSPITNADYLVVGGGGGGASSNESADGAAGGGAGGLISSHPDVPAPKRGSQITIPTSDMTVVVGSGGGGAVFAHQHQHLQVMAYLVQYHTWALHCRHQVEVVDHLVQVKMVKLVDLVVVHQVVDLLVLVVQEILGLLILQIIQEP